ITADRHEHEERAGHVFTVAVSTYTPLSSTTPSLRISIRIWALFVPMPAEKSRATRHILSEVNANHVPTVPSVSVPLCNVARTSYAPGAALFGITQSLAASIWPYPDPSPIQFSTVPFERKRTRASAEMLSNTEPLLSATVSPDTVTNALTHVS